MTVGSIADTVHTLHDGVHCGVISDSIVCAIQVVIDCSRQSDYGEVVLHTEVARTSKRSVTADNHQCVYLLLNTGLVSLLHALGCREFLRTCSLQDCTSACNDTTHVLGGKLLNLVVYQSLISTIYTFNLKTIVDAGASHRANSGIHSWCIASGRQDSNRFYLCHITFSFLIV